MILVAVVAPALWGGEMAWRRASFQVTAERHGAERRQAEAAALDIMRASTFRQLTAYHRQLEAKYRRAADRPWRSVEPDPLHP
jgi:hypothetical protein